MSMWPDGRLDDTSRKAIRNGCHIALFATGIYVTVLMVIIGQIILLALLVPAYLIASLAWFLLGAAAENEETEVYRNYFDTTREILERRKTT